MSDVQVDRVCKNCGRPESEHCTFEPAVIPEGCQCDLGSWWPNNPGPICQSHSHPDEPHTNCANCEHNYACHQRQ